MTNATVLSAAALSLQLMRSEADWESIRRWAEPKAHEIREHVGRQRLDLIKSESDSMNHLIVPLLTILELHSKSEWPGTSLSGRPRRLDALVVDRETDQPRAVVEAKRRGEKLDGWGLTGRPPWLQLRTNADIFELQLGVLTNGLDWRIYHFLSSPSPSWCLPLQLSRRTEWNIVLSFACLLGRPGLRPDQAGSSFSTRVLRKFAAHARSTGTSAIARGPRYLFSLSRLANSALRTQQLYTSFRYRKALQTIDSMERQTDDQLAIGAIKSMRGEVFLRKGDLGLAERYFTDARSHYQVIEDVPGISVELRHLSLLHRRRGDLKGALRMLTKAFVTDERHGHVVGLANGLIGAGACRIENNEHAEGVSLIKAGLDMFRTVEDPITKGNAHVELARAYTRVEQPAHASDSARQALREFVKLPSVRGIKLAIKEILRAQSSREA